MQTVVDKKFDQLAAMTCAAQKDKVAQGFNPAGALGATGVDATKILDGSMRLYPCSFMHRVTGYEDVGLFAAEDFLQLWNSPAMIALRESLLRGPLLSACSTCPSQM